MKNFYNKQANEIKEQTNLLMHPTSVQQRISSHLYPRSKPATNLKIAPNKCETIRWKLSFDNRTYNGDSHNDLMIYK